MPPLVSRTILLALLLALTSLASPAAAPRTLCRRGETDYFSCTLRDGRQVSICGHVQTDLDSHDVPPADEWLQWRTGRPGGLVLAWPKERAGSTQAFEGNVFNHDDVSDLRFVVGDRLYDISLGLGGVPDDAGRRATPDATLGWQRADGAHVEWSCVRPDVRRLYPSFEALNIGLHSRRPESDLLSHMPPLASKGPASLRTPPAPPSAPPPPRP